MATDTIHTALPHAKAAARSELQQLDINPIEDASADLFVANVMISAADRFVCDVRSWIEKTPSGDAAKLALIDLDTMLGELRDKVDLAKGKIDNFVEKAFADRRENKI